MRILDQDWHPRDNYKSNSHNIEKKWPLDQSMAQFYFYLLNIYATHLSFSKATVCGLQCCEIINIELKTKNVEHKRCGGGLLSITPPATFSTVCPHWGPKQWQSQDVRPFLKAKKMEVDLVWQNVSEDRSHCTLLEPASWNFLTDKVCSRPLLPEWMGWANSIEAR